MLLKPLPIHMRHPYYLICTALATGIISVKLWTNKIIAMHCREFIPPIFGHRLLAHLHFLHYLSHEEQVATMTDC